jgi:hypothetical protein
MDLEGKYSLIEKFSKILFFLIVSISFISILFGVFKSFSEYSGSIITNGKPFGGDFVAFYQSSIFAKNYPSDLYNFEKFIEYQKKFLTTGYTGNLPFIYPPTVALVFYILHQNDFFYAFTCWMLFSLTISLIGLSFLNFISINFYFRCFLLLSFVPFSIDCLIGGQTSGLAIFLLSFIAMCVNENKKFNAGIALGFCAYKPPLFLIIGIFLLVWGKSKTFFGFLLGFLTFILVGIAFLGVESWLAFFEAATRYNYASKLTTEIKLPTEQGVGLLANLLFFSKLFSDYCNPYYIFISLKIFAIGFIIYLDKFSQLSKQTLFQFSIVLSLLFSVQMIKYDLSILIIPILFLIDINKETFIKYWCSAFLFLLPWLLITYKEKPFFEYFLLLLAVFCLYLYNIINSIIQNKRLNSVIQ